MAVMKSAVLVALVLPLMTGCATSKSRSVRSTTVWALLANPRQFDRSISVFSRSLNAVDDQHFDRAAFSLQLQTELLFERGENGRVVRVRQRWRAGGAGVRSVFDDDVVCSREAGLVDHYSPRRAAQVLREQRHGDAPGPESGIRAETHAAGRAPVRQSRRLRRRAASTRGFHQALHHRLAI